jgi:PKD repeat protein
MNNSILIEKKIYTILVTLIFISNIFLFTPSIIADDELYDYVIVTTNATVANSQELNHFIYMKELQGHIVKVITENDFDSLVGDPPNERPEKIRKCLRNYYDTCGIDYALFIGDPDPDDPKNPTDSIGDLPMKMTSGLYWAYWDWFEPTDYYYADVYGNWDLDGDGLFMEVLPIDNPQSPHASIDPDFFSILWIGKVRVDTPGKYKFHTYSDDGARLYIDGDLVIDHWVAHPSTYTSVNLTMTAGLHDIILEYREDAIDAQIVLAWTLPGETYPAHITGDNLYNVTGVQGNITGFYYNNADFTDYKFMRNDPFVNFFWGSGDIGPGDGPILGGQIAVGRIPVYDNDYEQLDKILRKIIDYETDPGDISWRNNILLPMVPHSEDIPAYPLGEHIKYGIADPAGISSYRIYEEDYGLIPPPEKTPCNYSNVLSEWKKGYGVVTWATHGNWDRGAHVIHIDYLSQLDDSKPAFTFQASCATGDSEVKNNLGYSLLKHGAIATVSSTRGSGHDSAHPTWPLNPSFDVNHNFAYYYTEKLVTYGRSAGDALYETKANFSTMGTNSLRYNLYGDPDCYLLTTFPNYPPTAVSPDPYIVDEGSPVLFDGSASLDPEGDELDFRWDFDKDGTWDTSWSLSPSASFTWCDDYYGHAELQVRDNLGKIDNFIPTVYVNNVAPIVNAGIDQTVNEGETVNFYGYFTDPGCDSHSYNWNFGDGSPTITSSTTPTHIYCDNGVYTVTLTVTDDDGGIGTDSVSITVNNVAPTIIDTYLDQPNPQFILPIVHNVTFSSNFTDPGWCDSHSSLWDFDDSIIISGIIVEEHDEPDATGTSLANHTFSIPGTYFVTSTITDDDGDSDTETLQVEVVDEFGALHDIDDYIQNCSDDVFDMLPSIGKMLFDIDVENIRKMLVKNNYKGAIRILNMCVRQRSDGWVDGNSDDDWIIDPDVQYHLCMKIDDLTGYLYFLQNN